MELSLQEFINQQLIPPWYCRVCYLDLPGILNPYEYLVGITIFKYPTVVCDYIDGIDIDMIKMYFRHHKCAVKKIESHSLDFGYVFKISGKPLSDDYN